MKERVPVLLLVTLYQVDAMRVKLLMRTLCVIQSQAINEQALFPMYFVSVWDPGNK